MTIERLTTGDFIVSLSASAAGHTVLYPIYFDAKCAHSMAAGVRTMHARKLGKFRPALRWQPRFTWRNGIVMSGNRSAYSLTVTNCVNFAQVAVGSVSRCMQLQAQ